MDPGIAREGQGHAPQIEGGNGDGGGWAGRARGESEKKSIGVDMYVVAPDRDQIARGATLIHEGAVCR